MKQFIPAGSLRLLPFLLLFSGVHSLRAEPQATNSPQQEPPPVPRKSSVTVTPESEKRISWWRKARFGMFIHWGVYSIEGKDAWLMWSEQICPEDYEKYADRFIPSSFDPDSWALTAKEAGMQYMVLTAKHHDGFAMFRSRTDTFNSFDRAAGKDFVKEFTDAARRAGLRTGLYYSPLDWRFPGYFFPDLYRHSAEAMREKYHGQVKELMGNYGPIDILWYDGGGENWLSFGGLEKNRAGWHSRPLSQPYSGRFSWQDDSLNSRVRELQPGILINDRTRSPADFETREGEKSLGDFENKIPWELCVTLAGGWGYVPGKTPMSLEHCIRLLVNVAGRDGNLLLNVGPRPDGKIEQNQADRLREIGNWLKEYGDSIYDTRGGPYLPLEKRMVSTRRENCIYVHVMDRPNGDLTLPAPGKTIRKVSILGGEEMPFTLQGGKFHCTLPPAGNPIDTIIRIELDGSAMDLPLMESNPV